MTISITPAEAGANILRHVENHTLRQRIWHEGKEIACLLGAIHQEINRAAKCPAEIMPLWLAECTVTLFDGISATEIYPIAKRYGELVASRAFTHVNNSVRDRWLINVVEYARDAARPVSGALKGWSQVDAACEQVIAALRMGSDNPAAAAAETRAAAEATARAAAAWSAEANAAKEASPWAAAAVNVTAAANAAAAAAWSACAKTETNVEETKAETKWSAVAEVAWSAAKVAKEVAEGTAAEAAVAATWRATTATALVASTAATTAAAAAAAWSAAASTAATTVALAAETETSMVAWTVVERAAYSRLFTMLLDEIERPVVRG